jgi:predicted nuclease with TOPRIM domain
MDVQILEEQIEVNFNNIENRPELFDIYKRQEAHIDKLSNRLMILQQENIRLNKMIESVTPKLRVLGIDINSYA